MSERRALRTKLLVRQAYGWCLAYFVVKAISWFVLQEAGEPFTGAAGRMRPAAILIAGIALLGWLFLRRLPSLLGPLLTALLVGQVVASLVAVGVPKMAPIVMFAIVFFDYIIPAFLAFASVSASRVLSRRSSAPPERGRLGSRPRSLEGFEADE